MAELRRLFLPATVLLVLLLAGMMMNAEEAAAAARRGLPGWAAAAYGRRPAAGGQNRLEAVAGQNQPETVAGQNWPETVAADDPSLEYYVQVDVGADDIGVIVQPTDSNSTASFGEIEAFAFNVTSGYDPSSSQLLGVIRGFTVQTSSSSSSTHSVEVEVLVYDDGAGTSGTISLQGHITSSADEIAIVGGSGSFRGVSGYDVITYVNASSSTVFVYHHALYFLSSSSPSTSFL